MSASEWIGAAIIVGGLAMTNPTVEDTESEVRQLILAEIANTGITQDADAGTNIVTGLCKLAIEDCYNLIRATLTIETRSFFVAKDITIHGAGGINLRCIGAIKHLWCPKLLNDSPAPKQT